LVVAAPAAADDDSAAANVATAIKSQTLRCIWPHLSG
jgi:hypothetical protein